MDANKIKELIKEDAEYTVGALIRLYNLQTGDEQITSSTAYQNDLGFNAFDAAILSDVSKFYLKRGYLTEKQIRMIRSKLTKYASQLATVGFDPLSLGNQPAEKKESRRKKKDKIASFENDTTIKVEFTFDQNLLSSIKEINGRKFIPEEKY